MSKLHILTRMWPPGRFHSSEGGESTLLAFKPVFYCTACCHQLIALARTTCTWMKRWTSFVSLGQNYRHVDQRALVPEHTMLRFFAFGLLYRQELDWVSVHLGHLLLWLTVQSRKVSVASLDPLPGPPVGQLFTFEWDRNGRQHDCVLYKSKFKFTESAPHCNSRRLKIGMNLEAITETTDCSSKTGE